jgi:hypothetical protein
LIRARYRDLLILLIDNRKYRSIKICYIFVDEIIHKYTNSNIWHYFNFLPLGAIIVDKF